MSKKYSSDNEMQNLFENFRKSIKTEEVVNEFKLRDLVQNFMRKGKDTIAELPPEDKKDVVAATKIAKSGSDAQKAKLKKALDQEVDEIDFLSQVAGEQAGYDGDGDAKIGAWDTSWLDKYDGDYGAYLKAEAPKVAALSNAVRNSINAVGDITGEDLEKDRNGELYDNIKNLHRALIKAGFEKDILVQMITGV